MHRSWPIWLGFALCLAVVLAAMGWISATVLRLDEAAAAARRQADLEERVRLALWRMDSAVAPLVAQESARPYFAYSALVPIRRAYGQMFNSVVANANFEDAFLPSPLLESAWPFVVVHFQFEPDGKLTSPKIPSKEHYALAVPRFITAEAIQATEAQLARVRLIATRQRLTALLPAPQPAPALVTATPSPSQQLAGGFSPQQGLPQSGTRGQPRGRGEAEYFQRSDILLSNAAAMNRSQTPLRVDRGPPTVADMGGVVMTPLWLDGNLLLARRVAVGDRQYVQGCLLDWPAIREWLEEKAADLLPQADLRPCAGGDDPDSRMLAALPVALLPGELALDGDGLGSPIRVSLLVAWGCVLGAALAVALALAGGIRLGNRRSSFVSAVTHELRTPLTTFQMYAEMLAEDMVPDPATQKAYLATLRGEAARLGHLVENVLAYARLERGRARSRLEARALGDLIEPISGRLAARARQDGMELVVEGNGELSAAVVVTSPSIVEQILFNLVDNACKYARDAEDKRLHLGLDAAGRGVALRLRDHGPGIPAALARRLFRPFAKSAREAANSAPGIGLGLALSHRLARDIGAKLALEENSPAGACFTLTLPRAE